ncbi:hypothetical protein SARC_17095, partial [Sphaeroforma arctica JP610]
MEAKGDLMVTEDAGYKNNTSWKAEIIKPKALRQGDSTVPHNTDDIQDLPKTTLNKIK